jgi:hypothetical protein
MNRNAKEIRDALREIKETHPDTKDTINDALRIIVLMNSDLRRQGIKDYNDQEEPNE